MRLLHLACHFGLDTLSWARLGASVVGVDFSQAAITRAMELRDEVGVDAKPRRTIHPLPSIAIGRHVRFVPVDVDVWPGEMRSR